VVLRVAVPGVIGCLQALEAVKLVTGKGNPLSGRLLLYSAMYAQFRTVKLRSRNAACVVCGDAPSITELIDYEQFCRSSAHDRHEDRKIDILGEERHISCAAYSQLARDGAPHLLLDVRSEEEFAICSLPNSLRTSLLRVVVSCVVCRVSCVVCRVFFGR
jgi:adenylyltransferase/sulfurtransferase